MLMREKDKNSVDIDELFLKFTLQITLLIKKNTNLR